MTKVKVKKKVTVMIVLTLLTRDRNDLVTSLTIAIYMTIWKLMNKVTVLTFFVCDCRDSYEKGIVMKLVLFVNVEAKADHSDMTENIYICDCMDSNDLRDIPDISYISDCRVNKVTAREVL